MAIGDLYDADNVLVGQAACMVAPQGTPLPDVATANLSDVFDPAPWVSYTLTVAATTTYTLSYGGDETTALTTASAGTAVAAALEALPSVGAGNVVVTGSTSPYTVQFAEGIAQLGGGLSVDASAGTASVAGGLWTPVGATDQGWKYGTNKSVQSIAIEEQSTPVGQAINTQSVTIDGSLSEDISRTLVLAYNALLTQNAATADTPGYEDIALTDIVQYYAVALLTNNFNGLPRWIYAPKWTQLTNTSTDFRRSAAKRMYPVQFATVCKPGQIIVRNFTSAPTG